MKKIQDWAVQIFIVSVAVLAAVAVLGVWDVFASDVIMKSFQTLWLVAFVAIVVLIAARYIDHRGTGQTEIPDIPNPIFTTIRKGTLALLIVAVTLLALLGVLAIWQVLSMDMLSKALSSIGVLGFSALVVVVMCLEREGFKGHRNLSLGGVVLLLIIAWIGFSAFRFFWMAESYNSAQMNTDTYSARTYTPPTSATNYPPAPTPSVKRLPSVTVVPKTTVPPIEEIGMTGEVYNTSSYATDILFTVRVPDMGYSIDFGDGSTSWLSGSYNADSAGKCLADGIGLCTIPVHHSYANPVAGAIFDAKLQLGNKSLSTVTVTVSQN